jgi:hypothetical protein
MTSPVERLTPPLVQLDAAPGGGWLPERCGDREVGRPPGEARLRVSPRSAPARLAVAA